MLNLRLYRSTSSAGGWGGAAGMWRSNKELKIFTINLRKGKLLGGCEKNEDELRLSLISIPEAGKSRSEGGTLHPHSIRGLSHMDLELTLQTTILLISEIPGLALSLYHPNENWAIWERVTWRQTHRHLGWRHRARHCRVCTNLHHHPGWLSLALHQTKQDNTQTRVDSAVRHTDTTQSIT